MKHYQKISVLLLCVSLISCTSMIKAAIGIPNDDEIVDIEILGEKQDIYYQTRVVNKIKMQNGQLEKEEYELTYKELTTNDDYEVTQIPRVIRINCKYFNEIFIKIATRNIKGEILVIIKRFNGVNEYRINENGLINYRIFQV